MSVAWAFGLVIAPLAHAEQHLRERLEQEEQAAATERTRALAPPELPTETDLAALSADALAWQEWLSAIAPIDRDTDGVFGPLVAYELQRQSGALPDDGLEGLPHSHAEGFAAGHSHGPRHSHGGPGSDEPQNPFDHGRGSLAHSGVALHAPPVAHLPAPSAELGRISAAASSASCTATPSWHRPACAQSPPIA